MFNRFPSSNSSDKNDLLQANIPNVPSQEEDIPTQTMQGSSLNIRFLDQHSFTPIKIPIVSELIKSKSGDPPKSISLESLQSPESQISLFPPNNKKLKLLDCLKILIISIAFSQLITWIHFGILRATGYSYGSIELITSSLIIWLSNSLVGVASLIIYKKINHLYNKNLINYEKQKFLLNNAKLILKERLNNSKLLCEHKSLIYSHLSHSILNPLQVCLFGMDVISSINNTQHLSEEQQQAITSTKASIKKIDLVIKKLLDLEKLESNANSENMDKKVSFTLTHLMSNVLDKMQARAKNKNLEIICKSNINFGSSLFSSLEPLHQVLEILIDNAIKFTNTGFIKIMIIKERKILNQLVQLHFSVQDTGIGIPENKLNLIFNPYPATADNQEPFSPNTGLGLSIAYELIIQMNKNFPCKQTLGVFSDQRSNLGTIFWFRVRLEQQQTEELHMEPKIIKIHKKYNLNILVVEDCRSNQLIMNNLLNKQLGCKVTIANNGQEAIDIITTQNKNNENFDVIFMDIEMPIMNGLEATIILKNKLDVKCPIVACTANTSQEDVLSFLDVGMEECIFKPINLDKIIKILDDFFYYLPKDNADNQTQPNVFASPENLDDTNEPYNSSLLFTFKFDPDKNTGTKTKKLAILESYIEEQTRSEPMENSSNNQITDKFHNIAGIPRNL